MATHPDKAWDTSTEKFQQVLEAFEKVKRHFEAINGNDKQIESDDDELFFRDNFEKFNFPFENKGSFTVAIEDDLADVWQDCISLLLGNPKVRVNAWGTECDRIWKVSYELDEMSQTDITIHIYIRPKNKKGSKLMLQASRQSLLCSYVFHELPKVYKMVSERKLKAVEKSVSKIGSKSLVKCDQCSYKSTMLHMKKHIQTVHIKVTRASKCQFSFTPYIKPPKRCKSKTDSVTETASPSVASLVKQATLEESINTMESEDSFNTVPKQLVYSCATCDFDCSSMIDLSKHSKSHQVVSDQLCIDTANVPSLASSEILLAEDCESIIDDEEVQETSEISAIQLHENVNTAAAPETEKELETFHCDDCNLLFETSLDLEWHLETQHELNYEKCKLCEFV